MSRRSSVFKLHLQSRCNFENIWTARRGAASRTAIAKAIIESTDRVFALIKRAQLRERDLRGGAWVLKIREFRFNETRLIWAGRFATSNKAKWTDKEEAGEVSVWLSIVAVLCNKGGFLLCPAPLSLPSPRLSASTTRYPAAPRRLYASLFSVPAQTVPASRAGLPPRKKSYRHC